MEALLFDSQGQPVLARSRRWPIFLPLTLIVTIGAIFSLNTGNNYPLLAAAGVALLVLVVWGVKFTQVRTEWLIFPLALIYLIIPVSLLNEQIRGVIHYGGLALFCLPLLPRLYRSGFLTQGYFKWYSIYFLWALLSVSYSLAPAFSLGRLFGAVLGFAAIAICVREIEDGPQAYRLLIRFAIACAIAVVLLALSALLLPSSIVWQYPTDGYDPKFLNELREQGITIGGLDRFKGYLGNANDVGFLTAVTVGSVAACWRFFSRRQKFLFGLIALIALGAAILADSRSPLIGLLISGITYLLWRYRMRGVLIAALLLAIIIAVVVLHGGSYAMRGDITTLTGRTDVWAFAIYQIREHPILGYGYEVGGAIFGSRYFPVWYGPWDEGPRSSLHNGYIAHAVGLGLPAAALWLFIVLRPWIYIFSRKDDPWNLKPIAILIVLPAMILNLSEASLNDFLGITGLLFGLSWGIAERYRLLTEAQSIKVRREAFVAAPAAAQALMFDHRTWTAIGSNPF